MSIRSLKFIFWASYFSLIIGHTAAECVDLSGNYLCHRSGQIQISQMDDGQGPAVYKFLLENGITFQYVTNGRADAFGNISVCDQGRLRVYNNTSTPHLVVDYDQDGQGSVLNVRAYYTENRASNPFSIADRDLTPISSSTYSCNRM